MEVIKSTLDWLKVFIGDKNGIKTLYLVIAIIPSLCIGQLYRMSLQDNETLKLENNNYKELLKECYVSKDNIRKEVKDELMLDLQRATNMINSFKNDLRYENKNLKDNADKLEEEIKHLNNS